MHKRTIHYFKKIDSTMNVALKFADKGHPDYTVVVAEQQHSGFGRMGRKWISDLGGLYFSIIIRPNIAIDLISHINLAVAIDIARTIEYLYGINVGLKWPNDVLFKDNKLCGIISRIKTSSDKIIYIVIGVGLNSNNNPCLIQPKAVSISNMLGRKVKNRRILSTFLSHFELRLPSFKNENIIKKWKEMNVTLGENVKILTSKNEIKGIANDIDIMGNLKVIKSDGSIKTVIYGDCFHC